MFKTLFFIFALVLTAKSAISAVNARWLTVTAVSIDDGKTRLLFDPAWTRPSFKHWTGISKLTSDEALVKAVLEKNQLTKIDAVFASHSHFDHVIDAPLAAKLGNGIFYVDESSERIAKAYKDPAIKTQRYKAEEKIKVGDFTITPLTRGHAKILHMFAFLPGPVPEDCSLSFFDYHEGETWFYLVEHPEGVILVDQGSKAHPEILKKHTTKVDVLFQGVANRKNDEDIVEGHAKTYQPKIFIPLHFDNFFKDFNDGKWSELPGAKLDEILAKVKKAYPTMQVDRPEYGKSMTVLEIKR